MEVMPSNKSDQKRLLDGLYVHTPNLLRRNAYGGHVCAMPFTPLQGKSASVCVAEAEANLKSLAAQTREKPCHVDLCPDAR